MKPALALIALYFSVASIANEEELDMMPVSDWGNSTMEESEEGADNQFDPSQLYQPADDSEVGNSTEYGSIYLPYEDGDDIEDEYEYSSGSYEDMDEDEELPESELYDDE